MDYFVANSLVAPAHIGLQNKPGAVPVKNSQSIVSIKKERRVPRSIFSSDEESGEDDFFEKQGRGHPESENTTVVPEPNKEIEIREEGDSLPRRLMRFKQQGHHDDDDDKSRKRKIREFEVSDAEENIENLRKCIKLDSSDSSEEEEEHSEKNIERRREVMQQRIPSLQKPECITLDSSESPDDEEELSDEKIERRRELMQQRIPLLQDPECIILDSSESSDEEEELSHEPECIILDSSLSSDEEEELSHQNIERRRELTQQRILLRQEEECITLDSSESTDSEEEMALSLNPFYKPKRKRITVAEKEEEAQKSKQAIINTQNLVQEYLVSLNKTIP